MAITNIHPITSTVNLCLNYIKRDKFELVEDRMIRSKTATSYFNCVQENDYQEFCKQRQYYIDGGRNTRSKRKDNEENLAFHLVQSFDTKVDPKIANEIGRRLADELLSEHSCVISTHSNSEYTHNHIVFNAFKMDGSGKWHDCDETKDKIRKISDRLCEEYGLSVIERHREYKPIHWSDKNGRNRSYEPSERKDKLREAQVSSDQNSFDMIQKKINHSLEKDDTFTEIIKRDIDNAVKSAASYENMIQLLSQKGYTIRAKKKDGSWLKHISFKAPDGERPIRDSSLGNEYSRVRLTERIAEASVDRGLDPPVALKEFIQDDINIKSQHIKTQNKNYALNESGRSEQRAADYINDDLAALNTIEKHRAFTLADFRQRLLFVSGRLNLLNTDLLDIHNSILKMTGMASLLNFYAANDSNLYRLQRKYDLLNGFFSDYHSCISVLQRIDKENKNLFAPAFRNIEIFTAQRLRDITNGRALLSGIISDMSANTGIEYPLATSLSTISKMKMHTDYKAAKSGDTDAAYRLVDDLLSRPEHQRTIKELAAKYPDAILVGIHSVEEDGRNKIPVALAGVINEMTGIEYTSDIYQINKVGHTNSSALYRLGSRAKFDGPVQVGRRYILVDDVITTGGSLEELRYYIESKGGKVERFLTIGAAQYSTNIALSIKHRLELESKYGIAPLRNFLKEYDIYGGDINYLTESEGRALLRAGSLDAARVGITEERNERFLQKDTRALSKEAR